MKKTIETTEKKELLKEYVLLKNVTLDADKLLAGQKITQEQSEKLVKYGLANFFKTL